jgi:two-component system, OmpR family, sensor kinase
VFRSLRFRLPALFLAAIVLSGIVATAIAFRLFANYTQAQSVRELRRETHGLTRLYADIAGRESPVSSSNLEAATGNTIFYVPVHPDITPFPRERLPFRPLARRYVDWPALASGKIVQFEFTPPGRRHRYIAIAEPLRFGSAVFGALVVATPKAELHNRLVTLLWRLAMAFAVAVVLVGALAWYLSRWITRPVLALSAAADEVAEGHYEVEVPAVPGGGEIGHLADRFREMTAKLAESEEVERNFLMTVSHELRTPLTAIRGHVAALVDGVVTGDEARGLSLDVIALETARLERLVGDVLELAKLEAHRFTVLREEVDMERLVDQAYSAFGEEARRRGIDYERELAAKPVILSDGDRVLQIISNLLANAFRWTPDGGRIELELAAENGSVRVAVGDNGPGIPAEQLERIFRPFWTSDDGGTGLGLAIARELAHALGGRIELETEPGQGSRFELVLPAESAPDAPTAP